MSVFPDDTSITSTTTTILQEYAWDFVKNDFLLVDGKFTIVTGIDAIKVWIYKALNTPKYRYMAYTQKYGSELEELMGKGFSQAAVKAQVQKYLEDCLLVNANIISLTNMNVTINGAILTANFTVNTEYGAVDISV